MDSESWYVLGNSHLMKFFMGEQNYEDLDFALKAYKQSEKNQVYRFPDLYFNRATIYNYLEQYRDAIADFELAHKIDPNLGAKEKAYNIQEFVVSVCKLIQKKSSSKSTNIKSLIKSIPKSIGEVKFMKPVIHKKIEEAKKLLDDSGEDEENKEDKENEKPIKYRVYPQNDLNLGINNGVVYIGKLISPLK